MRNILSIFTAAAVIATAHVAGAQTTAFVGGRVIDGIGRVIDNGTVIVNGVATRSCVTATSAVRGEVTTLEGLSAGGKLHPLQQAWIDEQVPQCGFCQNGQILTAKALLDKNPNPTDAEIRQGMQGALCRCMTYYRVQAAVKLAAQTMAGARTQAGELPRASDGESREEVR